MSVPNKIIIATKNSGKMREIRNLLREIPFEIMSMTDAGIKDDIEEKGQSYSENAIIKAQAIHRITGNMVISDDSGLEVDALGGRPGIHSARYATDTKKRIERLLGELNGLPFEQRRARFVCVACLFTGEGRYNLFEGTIEGFISDKPRGNNGFGFDPVFYVPEYNLTMAELSQDIKNRISHRAKAFGYLRDFLLTANY